MEFNCLKAAEPLRRDSFYLFQLSPQEFLVLIWSISEGWKAESILEPSSGFESETPAMEI